MIDLHSDARRCANTRLPFFAHFDGFLSTSKRRRSFGALFCTFGSGVLMLLDLAGSAHLSEHDVALALEEGVALSLDASLATRQAWSAERGRYHPWGSRAKRGHADGTLHALRVCRNLTLVCVRCGSLVHWMSARSRARKAGREAFAPGDGCSSRCCSLNHRPAQYRCGQMAMARALESGTRALIAWPSGCAAREVQVLPRAFTLTAVHGVLAPSLDTVRMRASASVPPRSPSPPARWTASTTLAV